MPEVELAGLTVRVPGNYRNYSQHKKAAVDRFVAWLLAKYKTKQIDTVFVHRVAKRNGKWVAFGGYSTRPYTPEMEN